MATKGMGKGFCVVVSRALAGGLAALVWAGSAHAVDKDWNSASDSTWNTAGNWAPFGVPLATDDVFIGRGAFPTGSRVTMDINDTANIINIIDGELATANFELVADSFALSADGTLLVNARTNTTLDSVDADFIDVATGGLVQMLGGRLEIDANTGDGRLDLNGGTLTGYGFIDLERTTAGSGFNSTGTINVGNTTDGFLIVTDVARTLTINATNAGATVDWDNGADSELNLLASGTLDLNVPLNDEYNQDINLSRKSELDVSSAWSIGTGANINVNTTAGFFASQTAGPATIDGATLTMNGGNINIDNTDDHLILSANFTANGGTINVTNGTLQFDNPATINNGSEIALGSVSELIVNSTLTINDNDWDFDGNGGSDNVITINDFGQLNANITTATDETYGGRLNLNGGNINVQAPGNDWASNGTIVVGGTTESRIFGDEFTQTAGSVTVNAGADLEVDSVNVWDGGNFIVNGTATLDGTTTWAGNSVTGTGVLVQQSNATVTQNQTIAVDTYDWDQGLTTVNAGITLTLDVDNVDVGNDQYNTTLNINDGTVDVTTADGSWELGNFGVINLNDTASAGVPTIALGSNLEVLDGGLINVIGAMGDINTPTTLNEGSEIEIDSANGVLDTNARVTLDGGDITGLLGGADWLPSGFDVLGVSAVNVTTIDLDGGTINVESGGNLDLNVTSIETSGPEQYDSTMNINGGTININNAANVWIQDGTVNFDGGGSLQGDAIRFGTDTGVGDSNLNVTGGGIATVAASSTFLSDADVFVGAGSTLRTTSTTNFEPVDAANNGEFTGTGTWQLGGTNNINEATTINMVGGTVDLDNSYLLITTFSNDTNVDADLTINAATLADYGNTGNFLGPNFSEINIADTATLTVNLDNAADDWRVLSNGIINYAGNASAGNFLAGNEIDLDGTLNVTGDGRSVAELTIGGTVNLLTGGDGLRLGNSNLDNTIDGGVVNGPGSLFADSARILTGFGTINSPVDFDGTSQLIANGGTLEVNGSIVDMGTLRANSGTLQLDSNLASSVTSNGISLDDGILTGSGIVTLDVRNLRGNGTVLSTVTNNNSILAQGGTLIIDSPTANLDGSGSEDGIIRAQTGDLEIQDSLNESFNGVATVDSGRTIFFNLQNPSLGTDSVLNLDGGRFRTNVVANHQGTINVNANSEIQQDGASVGVFTATTVINANATLSLDGTFNYNNGTTAAGGGSINILSGSNLRAIASPTISTLLNNLGDLDLGVSDDITTLTVQDYQQTASGSLNIDIEGTALSDFDRVSVAGTAFLEGTLDVDFQNGFSGSDGDSFPILTFLARVGEFDTLDVSGLGAGLDAIVTYTSTAAILEIITALVIEGDYNGDGFVSQADLDLVLLNWGDAVAPGGFDEAAIPGGGPFDGLMSQNELDGVLLNWGNGTPPVTAIPEPTSAALLAVLGGTLLRRRR